MQLSYTCRLICLALCSAGMLQLLLECVAWQLAPLLLSSAVATSARRSERFLFLLALFARTSPWIVALCALIPAYMRGEDNPSGERVGFFCLAGAAGILGWSLFCSVRTLHAWVDARRFCSKCREAGSSPEGLPVLLCPGELPLLAVVGVLRSKIIISQSLLFSKRISTDSLNIAFLHEGAHARQRDNLKLLLLSLLPHISFATGRQASLVQRWRLAAEMAADEDGAMGRPEHAVMLADLLLTLARESNRSMSRCSFALLSRAEDLGARVDRLLKTQPPAHSAEQARSNHDTLQSGCALALSLATLATLCYVCTQLGHRAAELLLHIG